MKNPCTRTCPKRTEICHASCPWYKAYREFKDEQNRKRGNEIKSRPFSHDLEMKYRKKLKEGGKRK